MEAFVREQAVYVIRLLAAMVCGGLIGYERHSRRKTAGLRTHVIIALASALMMILSKYGFFDVLGSYEDVKLDPSRMASGIVTAIGFIGSGIIFFRNNSIKGTATSAGIWATVGVGMAMGSGMYLPGAVTTVLVILSEVLRGKHGFAKGSLNERELEVRYVMEEAADVYTDLNHLLEKRQCRFEEIQWEETGDGCVLFAQMRVPAGFEASEFIREARMLPGLTKVSVQ